MIRNLSASALLFLFSTFPSFSQAQSLTVESREPTYAKAKSLVIQEINFEDVAIADAIDYLQKESEALDPEKKGLNFVLKKPKDPAVKEPVLNLSLKKIPLSEVLRYIGSLTGYQVKYEQSAILLIPPDQIKKP